MRCTCVLSMFVVLLVTPGHAEIQKPVYKVDVELVQFTFVATGPAGKYINGLQPEHICVTENGEEQQIVSLWETRSQLTGEPYGAVFVLLDTSNQMYGHLARVHDAVADFVRSIPPPYSVAVYGFSRNLHRIAPLSTDREEVVRKMRSAAAGDETAIFDSILLTLRDAAKIPGPRKIVVFTNGPDDASRLAPMHVLRVAEETGVSIDMISIQEGDPDWRYITDSFTIKTGGRATVANDWGRQSHEFARIAEEVAHSYVLAYRPKRRSTADYRNVRITLRGHPHASNASVRARAGYWAKASEELAVEQAGLTFRPER
jgi:Ca-activated chloride channel homolog